MQDGQEFSGIIFIYLLIKISFFSNSSKKPFFQLNPTYLGGFIFSRINYTIHAEKHSINWFEFPCSWMLTGIPKFSALSQ